MSSNNCNINTFFLAVFVILIIAFTDQIFNNAPIFKKLFTDQINYILIILLVLLVILIDIPNGILLAFVVLYLSVHIKYNNNNNNKYNKKKVEFSDIDKIIPLETNDSDSFKSVSNTQPMNYTSESEFFYNNTKPFPNNNLDPFQSNHNEKIHKEEEETKLPINSNIISENTLQDRDGYDVFGCRYDFKNSPQNLTKYGPPLSDCNTYDKDKVNMCGTVFYPLNA